MPLPDAPRRAPDGAVETDVLVVGAGVAGLFAAWRTVEDAPGTDVVVLDKGRPGASGSSPWAQGGIAVAVGADDAPDLHAADTVAAGDGLCDPAAVEVLVREGPRRLAELEAAGAAFDRGHDGRLHLAREGGQSVARSVHRADATGAEMVRALRETVATRVHRMGGTAVSLAVHRDVGVVGCWALVDGELIPVRAGALLLATGGCGGLFAATTNRGTATADGVALAWRAGAAVRDLEFVQFHPTGLRAGADGAPHLLLTEALRGAGATLHDRAGRRFLADVHPDAELAPRHVVTKAILAQGGGAWLDATHLGEERLAEEFPTVLEGARAYGFDLARDRVPVTPAAHYMTGGVRTDLDGRTSLPGLWAAGEAASTGCHGANRMAGNSLLEALVFGGRAARDVVRALPSGRPPLGEPPALRPPPAADLEAVRSRLRGAMWDGCGPIRTAASLGRAARTVAGLAGEVGPPAADPAQLELVHGVTVAGLLIRAAALRTESRGGHVRDDHPERSPEWDDVHVERVRASSPTG